MPVSAAYILCTSCEPMLVEPVVIPCVQLHILNAYISSRVRARCPTLDIWIFVCEWRNVMSYRALLVIIILEHKRLSGQNLKTLVAGLGHITPSGFDDMVDSVLYLTRRFVLCRCTIRGPTLIVNFRDRRAFLSGGGGCSWNSWWSTILFYLIFIYY